MLPSSVLFELALHLKCERHSVSAVDGSVAAEELGRSLKSCQMKRCRNEEIKIEMPFRRLKNKIETTIETAPRNDRNVNLEFPYCFTIRLPQHDTPIASQAADLAWANTH